MVKSRSGGEKIPVRVEMHSPPKEKENKNMDSVHKTSIIIVCIICIAIGATILGGLRIVYGSKQTTAECGK